MIYTFNLSCYIDTIPSNNRGVGLFARLRSRVGNMAIYIASTSTTYSMEYPYRKCMQSFIYARNTIPWKGYWQYRRMKTGHNVMYYRVALFNPKPISKDVDMEHFVSSLKQLNQTFWMNILWYSDTSNIVGFWQSIF